MVMTIEQTLHVALQAHKEGKLTEAEQGYRAILQNNPTHPDANHNLGLIALSVSNIEAALALFKTALDANPHIEQFWLSYVDALLQGNRHREAKQAIKKAKKKGLYTDGLAKLWADRKNSSGPKRVPQQAVHNLLQKYQAAQFTEVETLAISMISHYPDDQFIWKVLGAALKATGKMYDAVTANQRAVELDPQDPEGHNNLGNVLQEVGSLIDAETSLNKAIALKPDYAEAYSNLGTTLHELGRLEEAEERLRKAISLKPDLAEAYLNLCELFESTNRTDELLTLLDGECKHLLREKDNFNYFRALSEFKKENHHCASELLSTINEDALLEKKKPFFMKLKGDISHREMDYGAAFVSYELKNAYVKQSLEYKRQDRDKYFLEQQEKIRQLQDLEDQSIYETEALAHGNQPTFLIGFPRSGTTLLDTILRTHSAIQVFEELPMVEKMELSLRQGNAGSALSIHDIEKIDSSSVQLLSNLYFSELKKHVDTGGSRVLIDKLPLNILSLPLINHVFPNAKYILALRHPLDCTLSCWMQNFKLNAAMANMIDLERIVDLYDVSMNILRLSAHRYSLNIHQIRYEDLVSDFEKNVSNVLSFLNLEWEDDLRNFHLTAQARSQIRTPSSSQVIKPIYDTASYRWKNYEAHLEPFKKRMTPWIERFGYLS